MDNRKLIDYIETVVNLEELCFVQQNVVYNLDVRINSCNTPYKNEIKNPVYPEKDNSAADFFSEFVDSFENIIYTVISIFAILYATFFVLFAALKIKPVYSRAFKPAILLTVLLPFFIFLICRAKDHHKHRKQMQVYDHAVSSVREKNKEIKQYNAHLKTQYNAIRNRLREEKEQIIQEYQKTKRTLDKYYDLDIIYYKYRNYANMTSILEYLLSGRCKELEGHEGAYNILEHEILIGQVLTKLDTIIERLDAIEQNQNLLYESILSCKSDINQITDTIVSSTRAITLENNETNKTLASIEYTNRINKINIQYLADMEAYKALRLH
ncbi:MAG: hypothetical protein IJM87_00460 [Ruminococcus sp.]|nr:hypothetical protein [Ruminococcus sp.]